MTTAVVTGWLLAPVVVWAVAIQPLDLVEAPCLLGKDVHDDVAVVEQNPLRLR